MGMMIVRADLDGRPVFRIILEEAGSAMQWKIPCGGLVDGVADELGELRVIGVYVRVDAPAFRPSVDVLNGESPGSSAACSTSTRKVSS
jgi:hypothetical protein